MGNKKRKQNAETEASVINAKEALENAAAEKRANIAKTRFLSSMSHDIRTPMNAIIMTARLAEEHIDDKEYVRECLANITLAGNHLMTLINNILDISKVESGNMELNPAVFSISEMINNLRSIFRPQLESKNLRSEIILNAPEDDYVLGDRLRISQIFINLASNAVKYTGEGGHIIININAEPSAKKNNFITLTYTVEDNGIGIPEEYQKQMYSSFSRYSEDPDTSVQGSGLGLSICKQFTELMGGEIYCDSKEGSGTRFTVKLELEKADKPEPESRHDENVISNSLKGMKLLIAEDNRMNWKVISGLLDVYEIKTTQAENGQICLDILNSSSEGDFDAVLMDIQMPVLNGKETAEAIRHSEGKWFRNIPVIAMTADAFSEDIRSCLESGMNGHISKPIDINKVLDELYEIILLKEKK